MKRGLVLGCGGTLGAAWTVGALTSLEEALEWDVREADAIIGTSAGAELAVMLGSGVPVSELLAAQRGEASAREWLREHIDSAPRRFPPRPRARLGSAALAREGLRRRVTPVRALSGLLPEGGGDPAWLAELARLCSNPGGWVNHPQTRLMGMDYETGERVAFGSPGAPAATLEQALLASWAIPGWYPPVEIGGRRFIDGGAASPASADLALSLGLDEVVVVAPMASRDPGRPGDFASRGERLLRRTMSRRLAKEVAELRAAGVHVIEIGPGERELQVMGGNFMDGRRRAATLAISLSATPATVARELGAESTAAQDSTELEVAVIGAGISGIGAAIKLQELGVTEFALFEKGDRVGGTWRDNTYPGCACDVPSVTYSYSFAPNKGWSRGFSGQAEILDYVSGIADGYGVTPHIRFGCEVTRADWDEPSRRWKLQTPRGEVRAKILIGASGPWHAPLIPEIPGMESFKGEVFHSSRWNHDLDLTGKRVAVIGTGASAVQFVPEIQRQVSRLHLFQRTAQWVLPKPDHVVGRVEAALMRVPGVQRSLTAIQHAGMEAIGIGFRNPWILRRLIHPLGRRNLNKAISDPELREALMPDYTVGCKRVLMSNNYYPALAKDNVTVHPSAVAAIDETGVTDANGERHEVDVVIYGTGFHILDMPIADYVFDGEGRALAEHWQGSPTAYLGSSIAGFPNLFLLLGPNQGTGHTSAFQIVEAELAYMADGIRQMRESGWERVEIGREEQNRFNETVQAALPGTVYNSGCNTYFIDSNGRNSFNWPWSTIAMRRRLSRFDPAPYEVETAAPRDTDPDPAEPATTPA
jgi:cyclohexanone monooxygenase